MDQAFVTELQNTLAQIASPDSAAIKAASESLQKNFYTRPECIAALIHTLQSHPEAQLRQLAGIEVRKLIPKYWEGDSISAGVKAQIKSSLLTSTLAEQSPLPRHTSSRVISAIAKIDLELNAWSELLPFLHETASSTTDEASAPNREVAVYIIYTLLDSEITALYNANTELLQLFSKTLIDRHSRQLRTTTLLALGKVAENIDVVGDKDEVHGGNSVELFKALIPHMVEVLKDIIAADDEQAAAQAFEVFITLLLVDNALVSKHLGDLINFMLLNIAAVDSISEDYRLPALQFLITAVRTKKSKIQNLKLGPTLTTHAMKIVTEKPDNEDEDEDENDDTVPKLALRMIDYLSASLPPSQVLAPLLSAMPELSASSDPYFRRASLLSLAVAVEGSPDFVAQQLEVVLPIVVNGLRDSSIVVRSAALQTLAQLAAELHDIIGDEHEVLLPLIFEIMDTAPTFKVGKYACVALDAILETLDRKVIAEKYLNTLVPRLLHLLNNTSSPVLRGSIVAAIGSAAFAAGKDFMPYFQETIRVLEPYVSNINSENETDADYDLRGMSLDTLSAVANAVGKEAFAPYVNALTEAAYACLKTTQSRSRECGFVFIGVLAKLYGQEFSPFLDHIIPELLACLNQDEYAGLENNEEDEDEDEDPMTRFRVNSAMAMEKEIAADTLGELIVATKGDFMKYLDQSIEILVEMTEHFYDGIRKSALNSLWRTFASWYVASNPAQWQAGLPVKVQIEQTVSGLGDMVRKVSLDLLESEDERSVVNVICDNLTESLKLAGPVVLGDKEDLERICEQLLLIVKKAHPCQVSEEDDDDEEEAPEDFDQRESAEYDEVLVDSAFDSLSIIALTLESQFEPILQVLSPVLFKYFGSSSANERATAIGAMAEIVNGMKSSITPFTSQIMKAMLHSLGDSSADVRSNAAYGIGLLCYYSASDAEIIAEYMTILQNIQKLLKKVDKKSKRVQSSDQENNTARCLANACGCVARMSIKHPSQIPLGDVLPVLVERLPLTDGLEENTPIFELFVGLFKSNQPTIIELRAPIVEIFEKVFKSEAENKEVKQFETEEMIRPKVPSEPQKI
ncbi:ARM repeat-containing protein [Nadsonia fulvescens var. elongata DSM 6958]|uniref:ARM repeat-containing protein n=1 Tax=Nadsonia fulvescens var. elongata DSM 6958 TaxID=857566 RepID=A0A1E3PLS6_9ASCO|nr:ARM repeat-containing protein [Nadsonia fulvescens var. elongata DSM 6958]